jgi:hypothetical protein
MQTGATALPCIDNRFGRMLKILVRADVRINFDFKPRPYVEREIKNFGGFGSFLLSFPSLSEHTLLTFLLLSPFLLLYDFIIPSFYYTV